MYTLEKDNVSIEIDTEVMEIRSIKVEGKEFTYQQDETWTKNWPTLFPIVGLLKDNEFTYESKTYKLNRHGFFRDLKGWEISNEGDGIVNFVAKSRGNYREIYPFEFEIYHQVEINDKDIIVSIEVKNVGENKMYFSIGHHPAILVEQDGFIEFEKEEKFTQDNEAGLLLREPKNFINIKKTKVKDLDFTDSKFYITTNLKSNYINYKSDEREFTIDVADYDIFLLWTTHNGSKFVCFEPWQGSPDFTDRMDKELKNKDYILDLESNDSYTTEFKFSIKKW